jgi:hypothetical protein
MRIGNIMRQTGRLALAAAVVAGVTLAVEKPAKAISGGEAAAIGLGSFAVGSALGSAANPYNNGYYYPPGYAYPASPAPGYYPAAPYYPPRNCWDPYYRRYYAC